jgi:hypothetical protein
VNTRIWSLKEALSKLQLWGNWIVEYSDRTHLKSDTFITIGKIEVQGNKDLARDLHFLPFIFKHCENLKQEVQSKFPKDESGETVNVDKAIEIIERALSEHVVRSGMLPPIIQADDLKKLEDSSEPYLIIVADTGTLRRAVISYLHIHLRGIKSIWATIPTVSMIEIQQRAADIDSLVNELRESRGKPRPKNIGVLRIRPSVTCSMWEIYRLQMSCPIDFMGIEPSLLRQFPGFSPDSIRKGKVSTKNILQDRLIIESIKNLKRERAIERGLYLVTTDRDMASFALAENIQSVYVDLPTLPDEVHSVRYNLYRKTFVLCPIQKFLWDLTAVFSKIRLIREDKSSKLELSYYQRYQQGYLDDRLEVTTDGPDFDSTIT